MVQQVTVSSPRCHTAIECISPKVLLVDDDEHFRAMARAILEPAGFAVLESESVKDCISQLQIHPIDVVILDMVMPDRDGIEALQELRTRFPQTPIVTVSGAEQREIYLSVSAHLGAAASLEKARIEALCSLLRVVLEQY